MRNKYSNRETRCFSKHPHDSMKEADHCNVLLSMKQQGVIPDYAPHVKFELQPAFTNGEGKRIRAITYTPDFVVYHDGMTEIIDVKGSKKILTQGFILKFKMLQYKLRENGRYKFSIIV